MRFSLRLLLSRHEPPRPRPPDTAKPYYDKAILAWWDAHKPLSPTAEAELTAFRAEAEPLLLSGYEGLIERQDQIPAQGQTAADVRAFRPKEALRRLVQLYEDTGRPDQAAEWKQKLETFEQPEAEDGTNESTP